MLPDKQKRGPEAKTSKARAVLVGIGVAAVACFVALAGSRTTQAQYQDQPQRDNNQPESPLGESRGEAAKRLLGYTPDPVKFPVPRTKWDGKPDFTGVYWEHAYFPNNEVASKANDVLLALTRPEVWEARKKINRWEISGMHCWPETPVRGSMHPFLEIQLVSAPGYLAVINNTYRIIPIGRPLELSQRRTFQGDAVAHWDGDALVVEVINFRERNLIDRWSDTWSDALRVVERWTMPDARYVEYQMWAEDPKTLTQPWSAPIMRLGRRETFDLVQENLCVQDEQMEIVNREQLNPPEGVLDRRTHPWDKYIPRIVDTGR